MLHPDRPFVVLDDEDARQLVQRRHVEALVKLADVAGAVAEKVDRDAVGSLVSQNFAAVLDLEGCPETDGDPLADEGEAAEEAVLLGEHVHGAIFLRIEFFKLFSLAFFYLSLARDDSDFRWPLLLPLSLSLSLSLLSFSLPRTCLLSPFNEKEEGKQGREQNKEGKTRKQI